MCKRTTKGNLNILSNSGKPTSLHSQVTCSMSEYVPQIQNAVTVLNHSLACQ